MKRALLAFAGTVGLMLTEASAFAAPEWFTIRSIVHAGTGCPAGTVAENISPDRQAFTILFDSFLAEAGPGIPLSASRKNCQLNIAFDCPAGWRYSLVSLDTRGFAALDHGVTGVQQTTFYFQGQPNQGSVSRTFYGPLVEDYHQRDLVHVSSRPYGQCGRTARSLNINTSVRVDNLRNRGGSGLLTADSLDGSMIQTYGIVWERESL